MATSATTTDIDLPALRARLLRISTEIEQIQLGFQGYWSQSVPILDSTASRDKDKDGETLPGLKKLKEDLRLDIGVLDKFLASTTKTNLNASSSNVKLSTNAPYTIAVWDNLVCAPKPVAGLFKSFDYGVDRGGRKGKTKVKVDVVADGGRCWVRVNTIKPSRLHTELTELDAVATEDVNDEIAIEDTSPVKMARSLLEAAKANPVGGRPPRVVLHLTRLVGDGLDHRIEYIVDKLDGMGVFVVRGDRSASPLHFSDAGSASMGRYSSNSSDLAHSSLSLHPSTPASQHPSHIPPHRFRPTESIILDLSALIALVSSLTHDPLPRSLDSAKARFSRSGKSGDVHPHIKALTKQLMQEMEMGSGITGLGGGGVASGMLGVLRDGLYGGEDGGNVSVGASESFRMAIHPPPPSHPRPEYRFYTTQESIARLRRIVDKIGSVDEKRRMGALVGLDNVGGEKERGDVEGEGEDAEHTFWKGSRFQVFVPLHPVRLIDTGGDRMASTFTQSTTLTPGPSSYDHHRSPFQRALAKTCVQLIETKRYVVRAPLGGGDVHENGQTPNPTSQSSPPSSSLPPSTDPSVPSMALPVSTQLTLHTLETLREGAERGWTVLTANRTSVGCVMREMDGMDWEDEMEGMTVSLGRMGVGVQGGEEPDDVKGGEPAALWIVDPRSLVGEW